MATPYGFLSTERGARCPKMRGNSAQNKQEEESTTLHILRHTAPNYSFHNNQ